MLNSRQDRAENRPARRYSKVLRIAAMSCVSAFALVCASTAASFAQSTDAFGEITQSDPNAQLLLQADELVYDNDNQTITALGGVRIDYDGTRLIADKIVYRQDTARLIAVGNVEILQPDGTRTFADEIDITDDFRDGFVNSLRVITPDATRFSAESATRENGNVTTFNNGVYTACNECVRKDGTPLWQIKARRTIWNGEEKTIRFEKASFEFFGVPIAYLPVFTTADPSVKRKTGFLAPNFRYSEETGFGLRVPYFINLAPNRDLTLSTTAYTKQGFLGEAAYGHRLENGTFTVKVAGIHQFKKDEFDSTDIDSTVTNRGMIGTTGKFELNPRWEFGWNGMLQSDKNFSRTYEIAGFNARQFENNVYLTGIGTRSYFDARATYYDIQDARTTSTAEEQQGIVLPSVDYNYVVDREVGGGELSFDVNTRGIIRRETDDNRNSAETNFATYGADADSWRLTAQGEWRRTFTTSSGLLITPMFHAQGDAYTLTDNTGGAILSATGASFNGSGTSFRGMVSAGLELRYPILFSTSSASHVLEPIAQIYARPNEMLAGVLPNEDAHSLVFDSSSLFSRDKFSGYDRVEGGTRANLGLRYTGTFDNGWGISAIAGQSFHLAGQNSYTLADAANVGADSGLETNRSDYVAGVNLTNGSGLSFDAGGRFDEKTFAVRRAEVSASFTGGAFQVRTGYAFIDTQPIYGSLIDRHEISAAASYKLDKNWSIFGGATYDIAENELDKYKVGFAYSCDCFDLRASYSEDRRTDATISRSYQLFISLRTLGDFGVSDSDFLDQ